MLGTIIEQNGDGLLEESHASWMAPTHRWSCQTTMHPPRHYTDDDLSEYDMKRDFAEINRKAP